MQRDGFYCCICCDETTTLHVHHKYYVQDRKPWEYPNFALMTVCKGCHPELPFKNEDGSASFMDWEQSMSWVHDGTDYTGAMFWDLMAEIGMAKSDGIPLDKSIGLMLEALRSIRPE